MFGLTFWKIADTYPESIPNPFNYWTFCVGFPAISLDLGQPAYLVLSSRMWYLAS